MRKFTLLIASLFITLGAMAQNATNYSNGVYKIHWQYDKRGYLTYHADYPNDPQLAGVVNHNPTGHYQLTDAGIQLSWYLYTSETTGKSYLFEATTGKFITIDLNTVSGNGKRCTLSENVSEFAQFDLKATTNTTAYMLSYDNYNFCSGCGTDKGAGPVRFATDGQTDGGIPFVFVADGASITDEVKNAAIAKIAAFENNGLSDEEKEAAKAEVSAIPSGVGYPTAAAKEAYCAAVDAATTSSELVALKAEMLADVNNYEMPAEDKVYALDSYMNYLYNNVDGSTALKTNGSSEADTKALWKFISVEGGYNIQNVHTGLYINGSSMSETPGLFTLDVIAQEGGTVNARMGQLYIKVNGGNNCLHSTAENVKEWSGAGLGNQYSFIEVSEFSHTLTVTDAGWSTLVLGFNATIPTDVTAYIVASQEEGYVTLEEVTGVLEANVPVLVEAAADDYEFAYTTDAATVTESGLQGTLYNKDITADAYVLGLIDGKAGFGKAVTEGKAEGTFTNNANKAYFVPTVAQGVASYSFRFGEGTTGVEEVKVESGEMKVVYDLTGRRVENITSPGIYIVNGVKRVIR